MRCSRTATSSTDPYKEHHHPRYTPLETVPDSANEAAGRRLSEPDKVFIEPERIEHTHAKFD